MAVITCPHCRKYISSLLTVCPECGRNILADATPEPVIDSSSEAASDADSNVVAKPAIEASTAPVSPIVVRKSRNPFRKRYSSSANQAAPISSQPSSSSASDSTSHPSPLLAYWRRLSPRRLLFSVVAFLVVVAVAFVAIKTHQRSVQLEQRAFDRLSGCTNPDVYEDYILRFPDGEHIAQAKELYKQLLAQNEAYARQTANGTKAELLEFIKKNPDSPYCKVCQNRIDTIDWEAAISQNTLEAYTLYLEQHPEGHFVSVANESRTRLGRMQVTEEERNKLHGSLDAFLSALTSNDAGRIDHFLGQPITLCGQPSATGTHVVSFYQQHFGYADILGVHFAIEGMNIKKQPSHSVSGQFDYTVNASLDATLNRSATDSINVQSWALTAILDAERKFISVDMRKR